MSRLPSSRTARLSLGRRWAGQISPPSHPPRPGSLVASPPSRSRSAPAQDQPAYAIVLSTVSSSLRPERGPGASMVVDGCLVVHGSAARCRRRAACGARRAAFSLPPSAGSCAPCPPVYPAAAPRSRDVPMAVLGRHPRRRADGSYGLH
jgi:hypothetical protein